jgi:hypothetical protein
VKGEAVEQDLSSRPGQMEPTGGGKVEEAAGQAKQQGQQVTQQARQQAGQLAARGGEQVKGQLANQKQQAAQRIEPIQTALRQTAQQLREQDQGSIAEYTEKAADRVEQFSGYLRDTDVDEMAEEVRNFARRRPALFLGGAVALGFLGARFLKSSSQGAYSGGSGTDGAPVAALPPATAGVESSTRARRLPTATGEPPFDPLEDPVGGEYGRGSDAR